MKKGIHPNYNANAVTRCSTCGTVYDFGTTKDGLTVAICAHCHPFYTGEQQVVIDTANKISSYKEKLDKAAQLKKRREEIEKARQERAKTRVGVIGNNAERMSLRDLLKANDSQKKSK